MKKHIRNNRGDITFQTVLIILALLTLVSMLLLFASVQINCMNIRNGAKMELNNLSASIYADTFRSQRESNMEEYVHTLYSNADYVRKLEQAVEDGLAKKVPLETQDYKITDISLEFHIENESEINYIFTCNAEFYVTIFGNRYPAIDQQIKLTGRHNTKF